MRTVLPKQSASATPSSPPKDIFFNSRLADPSRLMHASDGGRYRCSWIEGGLTIHSDGNVTCGLDDPYGRRKLGNVHGQTVEEIWANPEYERLQRKMWEGHRCTECNLAQNVTDDTLDVMPTRPPLPTTLVVETTVRCNLRCPQIACIPNNDSAIRTRDAEMLGLDAVKGVADQLAGNLSHVFFFNYGDPFVNANAEDMLAHLRQTSPAAHIVTSTNGIPLAKPERARKLVATEGLDHMVFTIGGMTQDRYARYHVGGRLDLALRGMINVLQAKRELGLSKPIVNWRYLMFHWNDSDAEIEAALLLAQEHGVDEFNLHLTHVPANSRSFRFSPGSPNFSRYRKYISNALGYTRDLPMPDADGFYAPERTHLGLARWTSWQARKRLRVRWNRAKISLTTHRPTSAGRTDHAFIVTPWQTLKVPLQPGVWRGVELKVPRDVKLDTLEVEIVTFDHWFPVEELGVDDQRCLGVLVREDRGIRDWTPVWRGSVPIDPQEAARLAEFRFENPPPLVDW